jgi:GNAT superfamily N-acetyltransferase
VLRYHSEGNSKQRDLAPVLPGVFGINRMNNTLRIDSFEAQIEPITAQSRALLHELTVSVHWPHRESDIDLLIRLGKGYIALDEIGRPLGSAMHFPMGDDFAMMGMMVTPPRLQAQGAGRALMKRILEDCDGRDLRLNATRSGYRLYRSAGFVDVGMVYQHQGMVGSVAQVDSVAGVDLAVISAKDSAAIARMDARAFGARRSAVLDALLGVSTGLVAMRGGQPCGFALMRRFGKGHVIGPLVADSEALAMLIAASLMRQAQGSFVRVDTPCAGQGLRRFLTDSGLPEFDTVTEMRLGPQRRASEGLKTYGLAAHSLG